jgi:AhpD family alkylhydroperoxidase
VSKRKGKSSPIRGSKTIEEFKREREALNKIVLDHAGMRIKRFFNLDTHVYRDGALPKKTKELLGLVSSLVLRCDDCVLYHLIQCYDQNVTDKELEEALSIGLVVGGSITIPHLRRAFKAWEEIQTGGEKK